MATLSRRWIGRLTLALALAAAVNVYAQPAAAPAITFTTLAGKQMRLNELHGKLVLVHFWATSCAICLQEMSDLIAAYRQYHSRGFEVIAVAMQYDQPEKIRSYVAKHGLPFQVVHDRDGALAREFEDVHATPTSFLIDRSGKPISRTVGMIDFAKLRAFLESAAARDKSGLQAAGS